MGKLLGAEAGGSVEDQGVEIPERVAAEWGRVRTNG
jgi:hypothetical protein